MSDLVDLGNGVTAEWWLLTDPDDVDGPGVLGAIVEHHTCKNAQGEPYQGQGMVLIDPRIFPNNPHWIIESGEVGSFENLTLSPSVLCQNCGKHGYIRNGRWIDV